jgi:predicted nuclease of predicted toxin-antitoxin system
MRFLVDAQLPKRLATLLRELGHDVLHTLELPDGNHTPDMEIARIADSSDRVVVTKDSDFVNAQATSGSPRKILVVATGNIRNDRLVAIARDHHHEVVRALERNARVALTARGLIVHADD